MLAMKKIVAWLDSARTDVQYVHLLSRTNCTGTSVPSYQGGGLVQGGLNDLGSGAGVGVRGGERRVGGGVGGERGGVTNRGQGLGGNSNASMNGSSAVHGNNISNGNSNTNSDGGTNDSFNSDNNNTYSIGNDTTNLNSTNTNRDSNNNNNSSNSDYSNVNSSAVNINIDWDHWKELKVQGLLLLPFHVPLVMLTRRYVRTCVFVCVCVGIFLFAWFSTFI